MADLAVGMVQSVAAEMVHRPLGEEDEAIAHEALLAPMLKDNDVSCRPHFNLTLTLTRTLVPILTLTRAMVLMAQLSRLCRGGLTTPAYLGLQLVLPPRCCLRRIASCSNCFDALLSSAEQGPTT